MRKELLYLGHGKKHDLSRNPLTGRKSPVPRQTEIKEFLCDLIRKQLGL